MREGNSSTGKENVADQASVESTLSEMGRALFLAVKHGHKEVVEYWLEQKDLSIDPNKKHYFWCGKDKFGCNVFMLALLNNQFDIFVLLINKYLTQSNANYEIFLDKYLVYGNSYIKYNDYKSRVFTGLKKNFMSIAVERNQPKLLGFLLHKSVDSLFVKDIGEYETMEGEPNSNDLYSPLEKIFMHNNEINFAQILISLGRDRDFDKKKFINIYQEIIKLFPGPTFIGVFKNALKNTKSPDGTPLHWAILCQQEEEVEKILHIGKANLNAKDRYGKTPLDYAREVNNSKINNWLFPKDKNNVHISGLVLREEDAEPMFDSSNNKDDNGPTPLQNLVQSKDNVKLVELWKLFNTNNSFTNAFCEVDGTKIEDMASDKSFALIKLSQYIATRGSDKAPEYHGLTNRSFEIFGHKFNISKTEKLAAANALWNCIGTLIGAVIKENNEVDHQQHIAALSNGELGDIYEMCLRVFPSLNPATAPALKETNNAST